MRGSIVKRGDGFSVVLDLGHDPQTGKRRQKWHSGVHTKRGAAAELAKLVNDVNRGAHVPKTRETVAEYVTDWLAAIPPPVRPSTHYSYARNLRLHVLPYLGSATLASVGGGTLNGLYARLLTDGRKDQSHGSGLSPTSVRYVHTIIHRALKDAVKWGRLSRNQPTRQTRPGPTRQPAGIGDLGHLPAAHVP